MAGRHLIQPIDVEATPEPPPSPPSHLLQRTLPTDKPPNSPPRLAKRRKRSRCCRCLCWILLTIILLVVAIAATAGILYLAFDPKIQKYSIGRLSVSNFTVDADSTVRATFNMTLAATNPNKWIGIYYLAGGRLSGWYTNTSLCTGDFPEFYQGHRNTTAVDVVLDGETRPESGVLQELQRQQQSGTVPLVFRGDMPVKVKLGSVKLPKMRFRFRCDIVANSLTAGSGVGVAANRCKFGLKLWFLFST